ncbi:ATP-dependent DNA helicase [Demequina lutea]|uniref:DNA 3'-5' helicase n=1 Tax=Demequina lutea TaxID=431489 RepID=A0A7Y9Z8F2_9MICO|nr:ATP-dependent DNA helicase [Demequina lutea]NYI40749.1 superfamily I DNA/RNA helicase/RecB family exonuclease [Demequina lutea]
MSSLRLVTPATRACENPPDASQSRALEAITRGVEPGRGLRGHLVVTGGAGTGKTTLAVLAAADAVGRGVAPERVLVLAPTRFAAAALRDRVSVAIGVPTSVPMARTPAATAFAILNAQATLLGEPRPSLVSGAEQDVVLRELLEGRIGGRAARLEWGADLPDEATVLPAFREELRNLLMRAAEADLDPQALHALGVASGREEWVAAAQVYAEYEGVMALRSTPADQGARYDPATIVARAADALASWEHEVGGEPPSWDLVIVDDYQDATVATTALLRQMAARGSRLVLIGNADESVQGYRGAVPGALHAATDARGLGAVRIELESDHRQSGVLAAVTGNIAGRVGVKGIGSARATARVAVASARSREDDAGPSPVTVITAPHGYGQSRAIAAELRRARHGLEGPATPWGRMAVIARSTMVLRSLRSDLLAADIPCESLGEGVALHKEPAVSPLLTILRVALGTPWTEDDAVEVLTSRLIGLDPVSVRRLRRELVREERSSGGLRSSNELLVEALAQPGGFASLAGSEAVAAGRACAAVVAAGSKVASGNATVGEVVWAAWEALGVADAWRESALSGSARDDADLDAIIGLLRAAQTFTERLPEARAEAFLDYLEGQDFAADSLGARAATANAVSFATAASAQGREWDVVVIAGLEEGAWPRLTLRDSVLGAQRLADAVADGPVGAAERATGSADLRSARTAVLDDETRALLVAASRARTQLTVTAVDDGETRPSRFMALIEQAAGVTRIAASSRRGVADLRSAVAALRSGADLPASGSTHASDDGDAEQALVGSRATMLAWLAREGVAGADPDAWHGVAVPSTGEAFWRDDEAVRVSPSKVEWVEKCALRWALESQGGTRESTSAQEVGSLLHAIAEEHPHGGAETILADFDARWTAAYGLDTWPERAAYARGREMAVRLAAYLDSRADREVLVEHPFKLELGRAILSGKADRIELRDEGAYVVDLKTGRSVPTAAEAAENGQLAMYQLAVAEGAVPGVGVAAGAELAYLSTGKAGAIRSQDSVDPELARARLDAVVETMTDARFPALVNDACGSCALRRSCPAHAEGTQVTDS